MTLMSEIAVFIIHRALPGRRDDVHRVWERHLQPAIAANPAHEAYFYCYDVADPDVIRVFQQYRDQDEAQAFLATSAYAAYVAAVEPLLCGPPEVLAASPVWAKP
jgi:quinol monooxygenase YgiN